MSDTYLRFAQGIARLCLQARPDSGWAPQVREEFNRVAEAKTVGEMRGQMFCSKAAYRLYTLALYDTYIPHHLNRGRALASAVEVAQAEGVPQDAWAMLHLLVFGKEFKP